MVILYSIGKLVRLPLETCPVFDMGKLNKYLRRQKHNE